MLINTLNECIIDMKTVQELETTSVDTKKQALADYNFKQFVINLKQTVSEVKLAVENSDFKPSIHMVDVLKSFIDACDKTVQTGVANNATTTYMNSELKKLYAEIGQEWVDYYTNSTSNILSLLDTVKNILSNEDKAKFAMNKIKKAATWNKTIDNYSYLNQGIEEANQILYDLDIDENSDVLSFLKLVSGGNATIKDLTDEILVWIKTENLADKMFIKF